MLCWCILCCAGAFTVPRTTVSYSTPGKLPYLVFRRHEREEGGDEEVEEGGRVEDNEFIDELAILEADQLPGDTEGT